MGSIIPYKPTQPGFWTLLNLDPLRINNKKNTSEKD